MKDHNEILSEKQKVIVHRSLGNSQNYVQILILEHRQKQELDRLKHPRVTKIRAFLLRTAAISADKGVYRFCLYQLLFSYGCCYHVILPTTRNLFLLVPESKSGWVNQIVRLQTMNEDYSEIKKWNTQKEKKKKKSNPAINQNKRRQMRNSCKMNRDIFFPLRSYCCRCVSRVSRGVQLCATP